MSKKKIGIIIAVVLVVVAAAGGTAWYLLSGNIGVGDKRDKVFVEKVSNLSAANSGAQNRYQRGLRRRRRYGRRGRFAVRV